MQPEQRPLRNIQLKSGMSSYHLSRLPQFMQWEGAVTMLSPAGIRMMQTLRKLPIISPSRAAATYPKRRK